MHGAQSGCDVDPNADDHAFASGRVALSWVGHWTYPDYAAALGNDLVVLPLPDLGLGTRPARAQTPAYPTISANASRAFAAVSTAQTRRRR